MATARVFSRNIPYLRQQFCALLGNTSTSVKFICIVVLTGYGLSFSETAIDVLSVTPGYLLPPAFWVWTAFTFCFLELHFWEVLVDIITVGLCGKLIEPLWGQMEMLTFFAIVNFGVAVMSSFFYLILYMCTFNTDLLFTVHIHGLAGYIAGVSVTVKQIMPDHMLVKTPIGRITNRNIPLTCSFFSLVLWLVGLLEGTYPTMFISGLFVSWVYLRFYQWHNNGTRGDMADSFTFASFFPNVLQPPIAVVSNTVHGALVKIGLCQKVVRRFDMAHPTGVTVTLPGIDPHDMERRRQIALKALSERLSKTNESLSSSRSDKQPLIPKINQKIPIPNLQIQNTVSPNVVPAYTAPSASVADSTNTSTAPPLAPPLAAKQINTPTQPSTSTAKTTTINIEET